MTIPKFAHRLHVAGEVKMSEACEDDSSMNGRFREVEVDFMMTVEGNPDFSLILSFLKAYSPHSDSLLCCNESLNGMVRKGRRKKKSD